MIHSIFNNFIKLVITNSDQNKSLILNDNLYQGSLEWRFEFPEILNIDGKFNGFDAVIGNPPYIGEKDHSDLFKKYKSVDKWNSILTKRTNLYYAFIIICNEILSPKGQCNLIIPNELLTSDYASHIRNKIANSCIYDNDIDDALILYHLGKNNDDYNLMQLSRYLIQYHAVHNLNGTQMLKLSQQLHDEEIYDISIMLAVKSGNTFDWDLSFMERGCITINSRRSCSVHCASVRGRETGGLPGPPARKSTCVQLGFRRDGLGDLGESL
jgi:adenine-specific DNA methylase